MAVVFSIRWLRCCVDSRKSASNYRVWIRSDDVEQNKGKD